jgi:hypothetical protein
MAEIVNEVISVSDLPQHACIMFTLANHQAKDSSRRPFVILKTKCDFEV